MEHTVESHRESLVELLPVPQPHDSLGPRIIQSLVDVAKVLQRRPSVGTPSDKEGADDGFSIVERCLSEAITEKAKDSRHAEQRCSACHPTTTLHLDCLTQLQLSSLSNFFATLRTLAVETRPFSMLNDDQQRQPDGADQATSDLSLLTQDSALLEALSSSLHQAASTRRKSMLLEATSTTSDDYSDDDDHLAHHGELKSFDAGDEDVSLWLQENFRREKQREATGFDLSIVRGHSLRSLNGSTSFGSFSSPRGGPRDHSSVVVDGVHGVDEPSPTRGPPSAPNQNEGSTAASAKSLSAVGEVRGTQYSRTNKRSFSATASAHRTHSWLHHVGIQKIPDSNINDPEFDIFEMYESVGENILVVVAMNVFLRYNFISSLEIDLALLKTFFVVLQQYYRTENPYHNRIHAADVLHTTHIYLCVGEVRENFSDVELLSILFAAVVHDVGHLGISNAFLNKTRHPLSRIFNDQSTLENVHCALAFHILLRSDCNFFRHSRSFTRSHYDDFRLMVCRIILGTDMQHHAEQTKEVRGILEDGSIEDHEVTNLFRAIVHAADLSNPMKPLHIYLQWVDRVMAEFWQQGDQEAQRGMPVSILCNRDGVNIAKSQTGFINFVVKPFVKELSPVLPPMWLDRMSENLNFLKSMSPEDEAARITAITAFAAREWKDAQRLLRDFPSPTQRATPLSVTDESFLCDFFYTVTKGTCDAAFLSPAEMAVSHQGSSFAASPVVAEAPQTTTPLQTSSAIGVATTTCGAKEEAVDVGLASGCPSSSLLYTTEASNSEDRELLSKCATSLYSGVGLSQATPADGTQWVAPSNDTPVAPVLVADERLFPPNEDPCCPPPFPNYDHQERGFFRDEQTQSASHGDNGVSSTAATENDLPPAAQPQPSSPPSLASGEAEGHARQLPNRLLLTATLRGERSQSQQSAGCGSAYRHVYLRYHQQRRIPQKDRKETNTDTTATTQDTTQGKSAVFPTCWMEADGVSSHIAGASGNLASSSFLGVTAGYLKHTTPLGEAFRRKVFGGPWEAARSASAPLTKHQ
jgi:cAMP-specific phosphodiesterase 4